MLMDNVSNLRLADLILDQSRFSNKLNGHHSVHFLFPIIFILRIFCLIPQHIQVKKKSKGQMYCQEKKNRNTAGQHTKLYTYQQEESTFGKIKTYLDYFLILILW